MRDRHQPVVRLGKELEQWGEQLLQVETQEQVFEVK